MKLTLNLSALLLLFSILVSCKKSPTEQELNHQKTKIPPTTSARVGNGELGILHNGAMAYANNNQSSIDDGSYALIISSVESMVDDYMSNECSTYYNATLVSDFSEFCNRDVVFDELKKLDAAWATLVNNGKMTSNERTYLEQIREACIDNLKGDLKNEEFEQALIGIKKSVDDESAQYEYANATLDIGLSSCNYWLNYWGQNPPEPQAVPVLAQDAAGALVGGTIGAIREYATTGDVTLGNIGTSALIGGVSASIGLVGKVAKGIASWLGW